jgi:hypothetical protein
MKTGVATKSSRAKSARARARREHEARRQKSANTVSRDTVVALVESLKELEAMGVNWLQEHSPHDGAAVRDLNHLIERTEQETRAWREPAEKESQYPHPEGLAGFRCQDCDARFLADRVFDVARKAEVALLAAGQRAELTPTDEMMAEAFEAPRKWMRCPECASSNICHIQGPDEVDPSMETALDVAGEIIDEIKSQLPDFTDSAEVRIECMSHLWILCASLSRGCELAREKDKLHELVGEFGRKEGFERWERWIEEKKIGRHDGGPMTREGEQ